MSKIYGNMIGAYSNIGKTIIIEDENGNELAGVVTDQEVIFTAKADTDIREGMVAATDEGIVTGSKVIPSYHIQHSVKIVTPGEKFTISIPHLDRYDYTALHCIICPWNSSLTNSTAADKIVVYDQVFPVLSSEAISNVVKDDKTKSIDLSITNDTEVNQLIRYITYKEII